MFGQLKKQFLGATALASLVCCAAMPVFAAETATVPGNVSPWAVKAPKMGTAAGTRAVEIAVHMALRDPDGLKNFVAKVSKPGSPEYGHYLTKEAVRARFAPDQADVDSVKTLLQSAGMTDIHVGPSGAYVSARATVAQLRTTFNVTQDTYQVGSATLRANKEAPTIPAALGGKILFIEGLDESDALRRPFHHSATQGDRVAPANAATATITPPPVASNNPSPYCSTYFGDANATLSTKPGPYAKTLPWLACGYTPQQIRSAYGLNRVRADGTGVTVAIIDAYASPTLEADGNAYAANHNLPPLTSANFAQVIPTGIYSVSPSEYCQPYGWWGEESLDLSAVHGAAPGANIVYIGSRDCFTSLTIALLNAIYNRQADILTNSYGSNGESIDPGDELTEDQAFMTAAAQGQTVLFSSGDDGDLSQDNGVASGAWEATSPYVTGVGGTSLELFGPSGRKAEYGWGNARDLLGGVSITSASSVTTSGLETIKDFGVTYYDFSFYAGSGGGISLIEPQPSYQVGIVPTTLATYVNEASGYTVPLPTPARVSPDVSMVADPYTGYKYGESYTIANESIDDAGCAATSATTEYCEYTIGGTSLASPLMAGMLAVVNQARTAAGKPLLGFANPWFYSAKIGATPNSAGINDVLPPAKPEALLRGYQSNASELRLVTLNSVPFVIYPAPFILEVCATSICEGLTDVFNYVTPGYDDVTGLGVPYAPYLVKQ